jgi:DNA-binding response OmpR family regulator
LLQVEILLEGVWGAGHVPQSIIVAVHTKNMRDKVDKKIIEMVRGYKHRSIG